MFSASLRNDIDDLEPALKLLEGMPADSPTRKDQEHLVAVKTRTAHVTLVQLTIHRERVETEEITAVKELFERVLKAVSEDLPERRYLLGYLEKVRDPAKLLGYVESLRKI